MTLHGVELGTVPQSPEVEVGSGRVEVPGLGEESAATEEAEEVPFWHSG